MVEARKPGPQWEEAVVQVAFTKGDFIVGVQVVAGPCPSHGAGCPHGECTFMLFRRSGRLLVLMVPGDLHEVCAIQLPEFYDEARGRQAITSYAEERLAKMGGGSHAWVSVGSSEPTEIARKLAGSPVRLARR